MGSTGGKINSRGALGLKGQEAEDGAGLVCESLKLGLLFSDRGSWKRVWEGVPWTRGRDPGPSVCLSPGELAFFVSWSQPSLEPSKPLFLIPRSSTSPIECHPEYPASLWQ